MITGIYQHISKGLINKSDSSNKMMWFKTNFNMPVEYLFNNDTWDRYDGPLDYSTETTSYDLTGFSPGYEICVATAVWDWENNSGSDYYLNVNLYSRWCHTDYSNFNPAMWGANGLNYTKTISPWEWAEYSYSQNIGCASWEVTDSTDYRFTAYGSGTPDTSVTSTDVTFSNVPSTSTLDGKDGYIWVEGNNLCLVNANLFKHTIVGIQVSTSPGTSKKGFMWIDTSNDLHWVGNNGYDYKVPWKVKQFDSTWTNSSDHEEYAGTSNAGYIWTDDEFGFTHLAYIGYDGYKYLAGAGVDPYNF
jgi:hypothetical protein